MMHFLTGCHIVTFILIFGFIVVDEAQAQWPRGEGNAYLQFTYGTASATDEFNSNGNL